MSDTKHTPGPWSVINRGEPTLQVNHVTAWYVGGQPKAESSVAVVYFNGTQEGAANARLIAAAPALYEALAAMVEADDAHWPIDRAEMVRYAAREALAAAEGA